MNGPKGCFHVRLYDPDGNLVHEGRTENTVSWTGMRAMLDYAMLNSPVPGGTEWWIGFIDTRLNTLNDAIQFVDFSEQSFIDRQAISPPSSSNGFTVSAPTYVTSLNTTELSAPVKGFFTVNTSTGTGIIWSAAPYTPTLVCSDGYSLDVSYTLGTTVGSLL